MLYGSERGLLQQLKKYSDSATTTRNEDVKFGFGWNVWEPLLTLESTRLIRESLAGAPVHVGVLEVVAVPISHHSPQYVLLNRLAVPEIHTSP